MQKTVIVLILGLVTIASVTCFHAFGGPPGPPPGSPPHGGEFLSLWGCPPDLIEKLKLTENQLKEMRLAYVDFQNRTGKARNALMGLRGEKKTMVISGNIDQAKLAKWDKEIAKLASEVMNEELKLKREHLSKLTPEQVDRLAEFLGKGEMVHGRKIMPR